MPGGVGQRGRSWNGRAKRSPACMRRSMLHQIVLRRQHVERPPRRALNRCLLLERSHEPVGMHTPVLRDEFRVPHQRGFGRRDRAGRRLRMIRRRHLTTGRPARHVVTLPHVRYVRREPPPPARPDNLSCRPRLDALLVRRPLRRLPRGPSRPQHLDLGRRPPQQHRLFARQPLPRRPLRQRPPSSAWASSPSTRSVRTAASTSAADRPVRAAT